MFSIFDPSTPLMLTITYNDIILWALLVINVVKFNIILKDLNYRLEKVHILHFKNVFQVLACAVTFTLHCELALWDSYLQHPLYPPPCRLSMRYFRLWINSAFLKPLCHLLTLVHICVSCFLHRSSSF